MFYFSLSDTDQSSNIYGSEQKRKKFLSTVDARHLHKRSKEN